jgi:hypothetical protein
VEKPKKIIPKKVRIGENNRLRTDFEETSGENPAAGRIASGFKPLFRQNKNARAGSGRVRFRRY